MSDKIYWIDEIMKNNWQALLEEIQINGKKGPEQLYAWWLGEQFLIEQSLSELSMLQAEEEADDGE